MMIELSSQETAHAVAEWTKQRFGLEGRASAFPAEFGCYEVRFTYDEATKDSKPAEAFEVACKKVSPGIDNPSGYFVEDKCDVEHARDHLEGLIEQLYSGQCDAKTLEWHLEEVANALGYNLPNQPINL